jgi:hypothetical protein
MKSAEASMITESTIRAQILKGLRKAADRELDELASSLPALSWNQVFLEVDRLSRTGEVQITSRGGIYWVRLTSRRAEAPGVRTKTQDSAL